MILAAGLAQRADLPIPPVLVGFAASLVLVVSFWALAMLWRTPRLEGRVAGAAVPIPGAVQAVLGALGVGLFALVVYAGLAGNPTVQGNLAPTFVFVVTWVGLVLASLVLGDVFALLSPWRAVARVAARLGRAPGPPLRYPERLGRWPAAAGVLVFAWLQVIYERGTDPRLLALLALAYAAAMLVGMAAFGVEAWTQRADTFAVVFGLVASLAPVDLRPGSVRLRRPLSGATAIARAARHARGALRDRRRDGVRRPAHDRGVDGRSRAGAARLAVRDRHRHRRPAGHHRARRARLPRRHPPRGGGPLRPLARADRGGLRPGPRADAAALPGPGDDRAGLRPARPGVRPARHGDLAPGLRGSSPTASIWGLEILFVVAGHVAALALAHDRALVTEHDVERATRTQLPVLVVMVAFTSLALWLLASINA